MKIRRSGLFIVAILIVSIVSLLQSPVHAQSQTNLRSALSNGECVIFVADNETNQLLITCSTDGMAWFGNIPIGNHASKTAPSVTIFKDQICVAYVTNTEINELRLTCSMDGLNWPEGGSIGGNTSKEAPAIAVFSDRLCVTFVANDQTGTLFITCSEDGSDWPTPTTVGDQLTKSAPAISVFNNQLCITFVANNETNTLLITCAADGANFSGNLSIGGQQSKTAPAMVVLNNDLCITFVANNPSNDLLQTCSSDAVNWMGNSVIGGQRSKTAPSAAAFNNGLCLMFVADNETNELLTSCSSNNWTSNILVGGERSKTAPALIAFNRDYEQIVAKEFAPVLRFDQEQGQKNKCFPSDAQVYYDTKIAGGSREKICNTDYNSMQSGSVPVYYHYESCGENSDCITYWFFYGYQDTCTWGQGAHHADWERIAVKIVNGRLNSVMFFQHSGQYTKNFGHYQVFASTHPVVYVGKNSHGSYHDDGGSGTCFYYEDFRNPGSKDQKMYTWLNLVHLLDGKDRPAWMNYDGKWSGGVGQGPTLRGDRNSCQQLACEGSGCAESDIGGLNPGQFVNLCSVE